MTSIEFIVESNFNEKGSVRSSQMNLLKRYLSWAEENSNEKVYWLLKTVIVIPNVIMVPTIILMYFSTTHFIWYIAQTMLLFFANILVYLGEAPSKKYIVLYHLSIMIMVWISVIFYLMTNVLI